MKSPRASVKERGDPFPHPGCAAALVQIEGNVLLAVRQVSPIAESADSLTVFALEDRPFQL
jgi:hypothetical protein